MTQASTHCPSTACKGVDPVQEDVTPETLAGVGVMGAWLAHAHRCTSCGCVYSSEGAADVLRGYFGNSIVGPGWRSIYGGREVARP
ncbi:MAG: hypothetical protein JWL62_1629 [Hyphomicrobiales bacterium]|nr:hypothetical protein [Hyphomicrobiales bacterium]